MLYHRNKDSGNAKHIRLHLWEEKQSSSCRLFVKTKKETKEAAGRVVDGGRFSRDKTRVTMGIICTLGYLVIERMWSR